MENATFENKISILKPTFNKFSFGRKSAEVNVVNMHSLTLSSISGSFAPTSLYHERHPLSITNQLSLHCPL